jgi:hypothetical protein
LFVLSDECPCDTVAPEVLGLVQGVGGMTTW